MKSGGKGGANTQSGTIFENTTDLFNIINKNDKFNINPTKLKRVFEVEKNNEVIGYLMQKAALYRFLGSQGVDYRDILSKRLFPDECFYNVKNKVLYIGEKKWQNGAGSVDEKLQTCHFKLRQYNKLVASFEGIVKVEYFYVLNDFFKQPAYRDVLEYIEDVGCHYFYNDMPLDFMEIA